MTTVAGPSSVTGAQGQARPEAAVPSSGVMQTRSTALLARQQATVDDNEPVFIGNTVASKTRYGQETGYQKTTLKTLRLRSLTYSGTCPDGNCLFNAASQCTSGLAYDTLLQQADRGQDQHAELRQ